MDQIPIYRAFSVPVLSFRAERSGVEKSVIPVWRERISPLACGSVEMTEEKRNTSINGDFAEREEMVEKVRIFEDS